MPYLSKVRINPVRQLSRELLRNPHLAHGAISHGIPMRSPDERILWRWENQDPYRPELMILTKSKPDWTHLVEQFGWPYADGDHFLVRDYSPLFTLLTPGREFAFRVTANPVQNTKQPQKLMPEQQKQLDNGRTRGFRLLHRGSSHQLKWFLDRTERWGFTVPPVNLDAPSADIPVETGDNPAHDMRIRSRQVVRFRKKEGGHQVVLAPVTFEGRLTVTDPALLRESLITGIGPGKAYGCGLLTLASLASARRA